MSMNDPLGDLLSRIRNAQMRNKSKVSSPGCGLPQSVLEVLKTEGYIRGYTVTEREGRAELDIELKYFEGEPVIREIERIAKPGRRVYASVKNLPRINNGLGVAIVSTPKGVIAVTRPRRRCRRRGTQRRSARFSYLVTRQRRCRCRD